MGLRRNMLSDLGQITSFHSPLLHQDFEDKGTIFKLINAVALHYLIFLIEHFLNRTGGFTASKVKMSYCHI